LALKFRLRFAIGARLFAQDARLFAQETFPANWEISRTPMQPIF
jgi:hypothetical protein